MAATKPDDTALIVAEAAADASHVRGDRDVHIAAEQGSWISLFRLDKFPWGERYHMCLTSPPPPVRAGITAVVDLVPLAAAINDELIIVTLADLARDPGALLAFTRRCDARVCASVIHELATLRGPEKKRYVNGPIDATKFESPEMREKAEAELSKIYDESVALCRLSTHGRTMIENAVRVPMLLAGKGMPPTHVRIRIPCSLLTPATGYLTRLLAWSPLEIALGALGRHSTERPILITRAERPKPKSARVEVDLWCVTRDELDALGKPEEIFHCKVMPSSPAPSNGAASKDARATSAAASAGEGDANRAAASGGSGEPGNDSGCV